MNLKTISEIISRIKSLEKRVSYLEAVESAPGNFTKLTMVHNDSYLLENVTINNGNTNTTGDVRGSYNVPTNATGVVLMVRGIAGAAACYLYVDSKQAPDAFSPLIRFPASNRLGGMLFIELDSTDGEVSFTADGANISGIYVAVVGYWV